MIAKQALLLDFIQQSPQFVIPIYQRTYSWTQSECDQLYRDIERAGARGDEAGHFVGSVVYIEAAQSQATNKQPYLVIDGQQRLTTTLLLLSVIADAVGEDDSIDGFTNEQIRSYYLQNHLQKGERRHKLLLTQTDRQTLINAIDGTDPPADCSIRITENRERFRELVDGTVERGELQTLCRGIARLMIVDVALSREHDDPQLIFESMNSTGRELSQADLIRNYLLMGLEPEPQTYLYEHYWRPMEIEFGQEDRDARFDAFMRTYLTVRNAGAIPKIDRVYETFKEFARGSELEREQLVADVRAAARCYRAFALDGESDPALADAFQDLRELRVNTAHPLLLELYEWYSEGICTRDDMLAATRLVESYVFRRAACGIPTNTLNKTFANLARSLDRSNLVESMQAQLLLMTSSRRFPDDAEFRREFRSRDLYNMPRTSYWLRRLENDGRKERVEVNNYTIEHILPQTQNLDQAWRQMLGENWKDVQAELVHTLGNLTLTGYNSEYGARPFAEKRDMTGGFASSPLQLNQGLGQLEAWNRDEIEARAERLADRGIKVWRRPDLSQETLESYRAKRAAPTAYTIKDHPYLDTGAMRDIFLQLRRELLNLDPSIVEEFLKLYVAYKADTNVVDIVPRAQSLDLTINMPFPELHDPESRAEDITSRGRWGNGDVRYTVRHAGDIPYGLSLVRQSLERQLMPAGGGE